MHYLCKNNIALIRHGCRNFICFKSFIPFSTGVIQNPDSYNPLIVDYLKNTYGFSRDRAISASSLFSRKASPSKLNAVPDVLKQSGFSDTQIKNLISKQPRFLCFKVEKTLKPKLKFLEDLGFSGSSLTNLILKNPSILNRNINNHLTPNINFLRSLHLTDENIVTTIKRSSWLLNYNLRKLISCKFAILHRSGVPDEKISQLVLQRPRFFTLKLDHIEGVVTRVEKFGVNQDSGLFIHAVDAISHMSRATLAARFNMYKRYGWSESDIISAFRKAPKFLLFSEKKIRKSMGFLLDELRFKPMDIVFRPKLLMYSLEKRLKPRNEVLKILNSRGLLKKTIHLISIINMSEEKFSENYVKRYVNKAPDLREAYMGSGIQC